MIHAMLLGTCMKFFLARHQWQLDQQLVLSTVCKKKPSHKYSLLLCIKMNNIVAYKEATRQKYELNYIQRAYMQGEWTCSKCTSASRWL